jgi:hypothetical protein
MPDGVEEGDPKVVTASAIHIFKNLSKDESDSLCSRSKLPLRQAVSRVLGRTGRIRFAGSKGSQPLSHNILISRGYV